MSHITYFRFLLACILVTAASAAPSLQLAGDWRFGWTAATKVWKHGGLDDR